MILRDAECVQTGADQYYWSETEPSNQTRLYTYWLALITDLIYDGIFYCIYLCFIVNILYVTTELYETLW